MCLIDSILSCDLILVICEIKFRLEVSYVDIFSVLNSEDCPFEIEYLVTVIVGLDDGADAWEEVDGASSSIFPKLRTVFLKTCCGVAFPFSEVITIFSLSLLMLISLKGEFLP